MTQQSYKSVAVITSTIGRPSLERAILSVKNQIYPCQHYVFVDGQQYFEQAKAILDKYPEIIVTYLPMNTGAGGWSNSGVNAIAPFLIKEDIVCYLDDDNWYEPSHTLSIVNTFSQGAFDYVYTFRNFVNQKGELICPDVFESLGEYGHQFPDMISFSIDTNKELPFSFQLSFPYKYHIDTNCYAFTRQTAILASRWWYSGKKNDLNVFTKLRHHKLKGKAVGEFSINYYIEFSKFFGSLYQTVLDFTNSAKETEHIFELVFTKLAILNIENTKKMNSMPPTILEKLILKLNEVTALYW